MLDKVKLSLRFDDVSLDLELQDTISAAKADLALIGVSKDKIKEDDPLIIRAIKVFCKAEFSTDDTEASRYMDVYNSIRQQLALSGDYRENIGVIYENK